MLEIAYVVDVKNNFWYGKMLMTYLVHEFRFRLYQLKDVSALKGCSSSSLFHNWREP